MLRPGTLLGRYEIVRLIGRGGMGCVYEGIHRDLKKRVAIKTLLPSLAVNPDARVRFLREGEAASRIRHPHVVDVTDVGAQDATSYLVMEFLEGEDLAKLIAREGPLSPEQTVDIMLPVAAAISTAHDQGVIHRDLKPENIFLATSSVGDGIHPKVLDFGISKVTSDRGTLVLTGTGAMFGTTYYLPPEQLQSARQADALSDQYALGTVLYECVTGHRAFEGHNAYAVLKSIAEGRYLTPLSRRPDLPPALDALVVRAMSLEPSDRFASVRDLGAALLEFATPHARVLWGSFFGGSPSSDQPRSPSRSGAGGTMVFPTPAPDGARRSSKPRSVGSGPSPSTMRPATGEATLGPTFTARRSRVVVLAGIGALAIAGGVVAVMQMGNREGTIRPVPPAIADHVPATSPAEPRTFRVEIETDPRTATIELDGRVMGSGSLDKRIPMDGTAHLIVARAPGYRDTTVGFTDSPPPHLLTLDEISASRPISTSAERVANSSAPSTTRENAIPRRRDRVPHPDRHRGQGQTDQRGSKPVFLPNSNSAPIIE